MFYLKLLGENRITGHLVSIQTMIIQVLHKEYPKMTSNLKQNRQET